MASRILACAIAALCACGAPEPPPQAQLARGAYLAKLMGCAACHDGPRGAYAGGLEGSEAAGPWRAPNLTPDPETGIGGWTDGQIAAAVRDGVRRDGSRLHPIMPSRFYRRIAREDLAALIAFLRTLAPIAHAVAPGPRPTLPPPPAPPIAGEPSRGAYLVALMHCADCHATPLGDGSPDPARPFAGGKAMQPFGAGLAPVGTGTLIAANLTPDRETGLGAWSEAELARSVTALLRPDGSAIRGPMTFYRAGWSALTERDAAAIAAYLARLPAVRNAVPRSTFAPADPH